MLKENQGLLVLKKENKFYFSNFTGSGGALLITSKNKYILVDRKYESQAQEQCKEFSIISLKNDKSLLQCLREVGEKDAIEELYFEEDTVVYSFYKELQKLPFKLLESNGLIENKRAVKTLNEIEKIKKSCDIAQKAIEISLEEFQLNMTEKDLAEKIEIKAKKLGAEKIDFLIVVSGERGALPHGRPTDKKIKKGELVTIDFGCIYKGYHSDITRTYAIGEINSNLKEIYKIVKNAQLLGLELVKSGASTKDIDKKVREYISGLGYEDFFVHGLGHGLGLEGHEKPILNQKENNILKSGMVLTIEPGIYIPGLGGVRIEDTVLVKENDCETLTTISKEFKEIELC